MTESKFTTSVFSMDGGIQLLLANWIKENYLVDFVNVIPEPVVHKTVTANSNLELIKLKVGILINVDVI